MKQDIHISPNQVEHIVTYKDGSKREARLFYCGDVLCEMNKYARKYGHRFDIKNVVSIEPKDMETLYLGKTRRFLAKVCGILENSGLHVDVLHDFRIIEGLNDDDLRRFLYTEIDFHNDEWFKWVDSLGLIHMQGGVDRLIYTVIIGIKRINYKKEEEERISQEFVDAIAQKKHYYHEWTKGYENSISCHLDPDGAGIYATYAEEFKGMGNGHYYLAIDAHHAIFDQDD